MTYTDVRFTGSTEDTVFSSTYQIERSTDAGRRRSGPSTVVTEFSVDDVDANTGAPTLELLHYPPSRWCADSGLR